jgi:50S ribosomal protein L16 3-hydroxylase
MRRHWQKSALLVREAIKDFAGLHSTRELLALATRDDVESRLVLREGRRWSLEHGPFRRSDLRRLPARNWTLLLQGINRVDRNADALIRRFAFVPFARLDDLMVSYAAPGGGVGPHIDSYDVFLLQGFGRRRWRYGRQKEVALKPRLPFKILARFAPTRSDVLGPGDMLYLPPHYAHEGTALDACTTYSIGFRAAGATELATAFLDFVRDELDLPQHYADPDLAPTVTPARIDNAMRQRYAKLLRDVRWNAATIARFLGCWLSEPKATVVFDPPGSPVALGTFLRRIGALGVALDLRTQLLYDDTHFFINGRALAWPAMGAAVLKELANVRALDPRAVVRIEHSIVTILYTWYRDGFLHIGAA